MKAVGVKVLKNNLSRYLKLVTQGEVVYVTDRDEVIAEIRKPASALLSSSRWDAFLEEETRRGAILPAQRSRSRVTLPSKLDPSLDAAALLRADRADRA